MISLVDNKNIEKARKFHNLKVNEIYFKIINKKIGIEKSSNNHKLNNEIIELLKKYPNIIINGKPKLLLKIQKKYDAVNFTNGEKEKAKIFFKYVYETHFQDKHSKEFLNELNIDTCVYCNRNYTLDFKNLSNSRAQLDHWFPKADFPILALSFYNLIPSCQSCNHIKGKKTPNNGWYKALENINHPYLDKNDFKFTWFYDDSINKTKVEIKSKNDKTLETLNFNKTKDIYNANSGKELKDLLDLSYKYSKNYLDILCNKTFEGLNLSKEEAYRMIFGIEIKEEDYHKRPFSKFKHDIIEELRNIK